jgi:hypothetical protein
MVNITFGHGDEDLWLLYDVQSDETALRGWAIGKKTKLEPADDGHKKLYERECEQMALARKLVPPKFLDFKFNGNARTTPM